MHYNAVFCLVYLYRKGPDWQSIRSPAQQSIKPSVIKLYIPVQNQCAEELVTWLSNYGNNNPDVKEAFMRYSADGKYYHINDLLIKEKLSKNYQV